MLAQLFLSLSCPVMSAVMSLHSGISPPPARPPLLLLLTTSASLLVQPAMSSSSSPLFPVLSTFDVLEADSVCQVCL